jgi:hypothetical protein
MNVEFVLHNICWAIFFQHRFEFVKSSGTNIVPMHLPPGQERSARVIKHVSGQGPIYLRALEDLFNENVCYCSDLKCILLKCV